MAWFVWVRDAERMLIEIYIEALLVDEVVADQVWEMWSSAEIDDQLATVFWWVVTIRNEPFRLLVIA